jgi:hypothetical protein
MPCKLRDEIATRYVVAVQDKASDQLIDRLIRELRQHETLCGCADRTDGWEQLVQPAAGTVKWT